MIKIISIIAIIAIISIPIISGAAIEISNIIGAEPKLSILNHASIIEGTGNNEKKLRFLHLAPKITHIKDFKDGIGCAATGKPIKIHDFTKIEDNKDLIEIIGISDCKKWYGVLINIWDPAAKIIIHKPHGITIGEAATNIADIDALIDFIHGKIGNEIELFKGLIKKGISANIIIIKLIAKLGIIIDGE